MMVQKMRSNCGANAVYTTIPPVDGLGIFTPKDRLNN